MENYIYLLIITFSLLGCGDLERNSKSVKSKDISISSKKEIQNCIDTVTKNNPQLILSKDSMQIYNYPNLTVWGGLSLKSINGKLKIVEATHRAELGFKKRVFHINDNEIQKIEYIGHHAEWSKYNENYPSEKYEWNTEKMTYSDTSFIVDLINKTNLEFIESEELIQEGLEILDFIKKEEITTGNN